MAMSALERLEWIYQTVDMEVQDKYHNLLKWFSANKREAEKYMDLWQQEKRAAEEMKRRYEGRFEEMRTACLMILQNEKSTEQIIKSCERMMNEVNERLETWERGETPIMEGGADVETAIEAQE